MSRYFDVNLDSITSEDLTAGTSKKVNLTSRALRAKRKKQRNHESKNILSLLHKADISDKSIPIPSSKIKSASSYVKEKPKGFNRPPVDKGKLKLYGRGDSAPEVEVKNTVWKEKLKNKETRYEWAAEESARAELLLTEQSG